MKVLKKTQLLRFDLSTQRVIANPTQSSSAKVAVRPKIQMRGLLCLSCSITGVLTFGPQADVVTFIDDQ